MFQTIVTIAYFALMVIIIINSTDSLNLEILTNSLRAERVFIGVFVIDMIVKILF